MELIIAGASAVCYSIIDKKIQLTEKISSTIKVKEKYKNCDSLYKSSLCMGITCLGLLIIVMLNSFIGVSENIKFTLDWIIFGIGVSIAILISKKK